MSARAGEFELVTLRNGHRAVRHIPSGEVMHPSVGPWEEANALYVRQLGLAERLSSEKPEPVRVYDVGLGAATNAIAALTCARELGDARRRELHVVSFERDLDPLRLTLADPDGFPRQALWADAVRALLSGGSWAGEGLRWSLRSGEVLTELPGAPGPAELVFFDPFSPEVNPRLWTVISLEQVRAVCHPTDALLATYSAATPTRLGFLLAGFHVGRGAPVGTKKETTVAATSRAALAHPLGREFLERWERSSARAPHGTALTPELEVRIRERLTVLGETP